MITIHIARGKKVNWLITCISSKQRAASSWYVIVWRRCVTLACGVWRLKSPRSHSIQFTSIYKIHSTIMPRRTKPSTSTHFFLSFVINYSNHLCFVCGFLRIFYRQNKTFRFVSFRRRSTGIWPRLVMVRLVRVKDDVVYSTVVVNVLYETTPSTGFCVCFKTTWIPSLIWCRWTFLDRYRIFSAFFLVFATYIGLSIRFCLLHDNYTLNETKRTQKYFTIKYVHVNVFAARRNDTCRGEIQNTHREKEGIRDRTEY